MPTGTSNYDNKPAQYFVGARRDFVERLSTDRSASILEIGCGSGGTAAIALELGKCGRYVGVELMAEAAEKARTVMTDVIVGDVEKMDLPFADCTFDALIMSEVLEHLAWPDALLRRLGPKLKPGAQVFASSPNIANIKILKELWNGRFDHADVGVMDRTHLRWFTPASYARMFEEAGYQVEATWPIRPVRGSKMLWSKVTGRPWLYWSQICLSAHWRG